MATTSAESTAVSDQPTYSEATFKSVNTAFWTPIDLSFERAARARARCACKALLKPSTSTVKPASAACSCVNSSGKPYVSDNLKASAPEICVFPSALAAAITSSNKAKPPVNVALKRFSSAATVFWIRAAFSSTSG